MDSKLNQMVQKLCLIVCSVIIYSVAGSCKEKGEYVYHPKKLFMPTGNIAISYQPDRARLVWAEALHTDPRKTAYEIIVSADTLFSGGTEFSFKTDTTFIVLKKGEIAKDLWYYARIRTVPSDGGSVDPSNWLHSPGFRISDDNSYHNEENDI